MFPQMRLFLLVSIDFHSSRCELRSAAPASVRENQESARSCSARLQAGTLESSTCPPEGGRYINQKRVLTHTLRGSRNTLAHFVHLPTIILSSLPFFADPRNLDMEKFTGASKREELHVGF